MNESNETTHSEGVAPKKKRADTTLRKIAKEVGVSENTMRKITHVRELAEYDNEMKEIWEKALRGEIKTIKEVYTIYEEKIDQLYYLITHQESFRLILKESNPNTTFTEEGFSNLLDLYKFLARRKIKRMEKKGGDIVE